MHIPTSAIMAGIIAGACSSYVWIGHRHFGLGGGHIGLGETSYGHAACVGPPAVPLSPRQIPVVSQVALQDRHHEATGRADAYRLGTRSGRSELLTTCHI